MQKRIVLVILFILSLYFAGTCTTITEAGPFVLDSTTYTSPGYTCINITIGGAPTNVFINLNGSTITAATSNSSGIDVVRNAETKVTIENGTISNSYYAISLNGISVTLRNITILNSGYGIYINASSENNTIANITINYSDIGIYTLGLNSSMTNITITNSTKGLLIDSTNNTLRNITISNTYYAFGIAPDSSGVCKSIANLHNDIDNTTIVDGRPIYYNYSVNNLVIGRNMANFGDPSAIYIINGTNITVENITSQFMDRAVVAAWGNNITFSNITVNETFRMVEICDAHNVTIKDSTIGEYGTAFYDAAGTQCNIGNCLTMGINTINANGTNISRSLIKEHFYGISATESYGISLKNNSVVGQSFSGIRGNGIYNSVLHYNNITYTSWTTRPADTKRTNYTLLAPIQGIACLNYGCYRKGLSISSGNNVSMIGDRIYNTTIGLYASSLSNSTIHDLYVYNSSDGVAFESTINVTLNYSTITNGYFTGYKKVDFRALGGANDSISKTTFTNTQISVDFIGNISINSSLNFTSSPYATFTGKAINVTNESALTVNLSIYYDNQYDPTTIRAYRHRGIDTSASWISLATEPGVSIENNTGSLFVKLINMTNFSIFGLFGLAAVTTAPTSNPTPAKTNPDLSLSINKNCPGGEIIVSSSKGAGITIMYPDGWSDYARVGDSGSVSFPKRSEGTITVLGTLAEYNSVEKTYDYANCPTPSLSVSSAYSCSDGTVTYTVTSEGTIVGGANVEITNSNRVSRTGVTGADGKISLDVTVGEAYVITATKEGYNAYDSSETYSLCPLSATWSLKCPDKILEITVTSNGAAIAEATVGYNGVGRTDASGKALFPAFNGTQTMTAVKTGYQDFASAVTTESPCYASSKPEKTPEEKPVVNPDEKPVEKPGGNADVTGKTTETKPSSSAGSIDETVKNSLDKLRDAVVELTDSNEKKIAIAVVLIIAGFLAYNYFVPRKKTFKPKIVRDED